jgi:hypothetical protein
MAIKYTNTLHSKALHNMPKVGFLVRKFKCHLATLLEMRMEKEMLNEL